MARFDSVTFSSVRIKRTLIIFIVLHNPFVGVFSFHFLWILVDASSIRPLLSTEVTALRPTEEVGM